MRQISTSSDVASKKNILNRISYVPGGVSLVISNLVAGVAVPEGTPLTAPTNGKRTVCKQAPVLTGSSTTVKKVVSGGHHFKQGDFLCTKEGGKAYAITTITTSNGVDSITVGTAIEATAAGEFIYEATEEAATDTSAFKNTPEVILESAFTVPSDTMVIQIAVALVRADIVADFMGPLYLAELPFIAVIKY